MISISLQLQILPFALVGLLASCLVFSYSLVSICWHSLIVVFVDPSIRIHVPYASLVIFNLHITYQLRMLELILPVASAEAAGCLEVECVYRKPLSAITIELSKASKYIAVTHQPSI